MTSYSLKEWYGKYIVTQTDTETGRKSYLGYVRNGATIWYFDPLYAKPYSLQTAKRHMRDLQARITTHLMRTGR